MLRLCVIGNPISHSRSPAIHAELLQKAGIPGTYKAVMVTEHTLCDFVAEARSGAWDGFNVTMPLKTAIIPFLDAMDETAQRMNAVNTVVVRNRRLTGYNTDGPGFVQSLGFAPVGRSVLILGNGGASRAVRCAMEKAGARVTVCCRHPREKEKSWNELCKLSESCDILVNATPLGMVGKENFADWTFLERLPREAMVYDLVYNPLETELLQRAKERKYDTMGGFSLLQAQAELAFSYFTE